MLDPPLTRPASPTANSTARAKKDGLAEAGENVAAICLSGNMTLQTAGCLPVWRQLDRVLGWELQEEGNLGVVTALKGHHL